MSAVPGDRRGARVQGESIVRHEWNVNAIEVATAMIGGMKPCMVQELNAAFWEADRDERVHVATQRGEARIGDGCHAPNTRAKTASTWPR